MQIIPYDEWERKEHCDFYGGLEIPFYSLTAPIEVTKLVNYCKKEKISFFYAMIYATVTIMNKIPEFRYRLRGENVILYDELVPSFTDLMKGTKLHKICKCPIAGSIKEYAIKAKDIAAEQTYFFPSEEEESRDDYVYITSVPWLSYTAITNTYTSNKDDFIPRIAWGKYEEIDGKIKMPFSVHINHRVADGIHIGELFNGIEEYIDKM